MKKQSILIVGGVVLLLSLVSTINYIPKSKLVELKGKTRTEKIKDCLYIQVMDRSGQIDGKVFITYTCMCDGYQFQIKRTGLKYNRFGRTKYLSRPTPMVIKDTRSTEISIPFGITPKVAYAFDDDVKVFVSE